MSFKPHQLDRLSTLANCLEWFNICLSSSYLVLIFSETRIITPPKIYSRTCQAIASFCSSLKSSVCNRSVIFYVIFWFLSLKEDFQIVSYGLPCWTGENCSYICVFVPILLEHPIYLLRLIISFIPPNDTKCCIQTLIQTCSHSLCFMLFTSAHCWF